VALASQLDLFRHFKALLCLLLRQEVSRKRIGGCHEPCSTRHGTSAKLMQVNFETQNLSHRIPKQYRQFET
jgi:hypothetical protein